MKLYAGDLPTHSNYKDLLGLSLTQKNQNHIMWDLTNLPLPFDDNSIDFFQSEDVFEHIPYKLLAQIFDEIYRVLKPNALFRLSVPDYNCDVLYKRSIYDYDGNIVFDPGGGGTFEEPGHVWFPVYDIVKSLVEQTKFYSLGKVEFLHYWTDKDSFNIKKIDYSKGYILRTPDHDQRVQNPYRPMSIVVDLFKAKI